MADSLNQNHESSIVNCLSDTLNTTTTPSIPPSREPTATVPPPRFTPPLQAIPALPQTPTAKEDPRLLPSPADSTGHTVIRLRNTGNPVLGPKTRQPAGRNVFSPCRILILPPLPPGHTLIFTFPHGLPSLYFSFSSPSYIFQFQYPACYHQWSSHDLQWIQKSSSPVWVQALSVEFSLSSSFLSYPWS